MLLRSRKIRLAKRKNSCAILCWPILFTKQNILSIRLVQMSRSKQLPLGVRFNQQATDPSTCLFCLLGCCKICSLRSHTLKYAPSFSNSAPTTKQNILRIHLPDSRKISRSKQLVGLGRFELPTSPLSGVRSNQLSYRPKISHINQTKHPTRA